MSAREQISEQSQDIHFVARLRSLLKEIDFARPLFRARGQNRVRTVFFAHGPAMRSRPLPAPAERTRSLFSKEALPNLFSSWCHACCLRHVEQDVWLVESVFIFDALRTPYLALLVKSGQ
jgi:hypothetical protein